MENNYLKYYKPNIAIVVVGILAIGLYLAKNHWGLSISLFSVIGGLLFVIDKWLWSYKVVIWLFEVEDFRGIYESVLEYEFRDDFGKLNQGMLQHKKEIHQTGSKITIISTTYKPDGAISSESKNQNITVKKEDNGTFTLIYTYLNQGDFSQNFPPHFGTDVLTFNKKELTGYYYTNRTPYQTRGKYILK